VASSADASTPYALHAERPEDIQHPLVHLHSHAPRISTSGLRCINHRQGFAEAGPQLDTSWPAAGCKLALLDVNALRLSITIEANDPRVSHCLIHPELRVE
jgi:hypothetical protein